MTQPGVTPPEAGPLARWCAAELRERDWEGDEELADALHPGDRPVPLRRRLPVDLEELAMILEGDPLQGGGGRSTCPTARCARGRARVRAGDRGAGAGPRRQRGVAGGRVRGSRGGYHDIVDFIGSVGEERLAERLEVAIGGRGAFRRFKDVLAEDPEELTRWHAYSDDRQRGRARAWLAGHGYTAAPAATAAGGAAPPR